MTDEDMHSGEHHGGHKAERISVWTLMARRDAYAIRPVAGHPESSTYGGTSRYVEIFLLDIRSR